MSDLALLRIARAKREGERRLDLGKCALRELPPELWELEGLEELSLAYNPLVDISGLDRLPTLQKLDLRSNPHLADFSVLGELHQLRHLDLNSNRVEDLSMLRGLHQLRALYLIANRLTAIDVLRELPQLSTLYLSSNKDIRDFSPLRSLTQLEVLDLRSNRIQDLSVLRDLHQLRQLDLSTNKQIRDYQVLLHLPHLQTLNLSSNGVANIDVLQSLDELQHLYLSYNQIDDIAILQNLRALRTLYLRYNQIRDLSVLRNLRQLEVLALSSNRLTDLRPLRPLRNQHSLFLSSNPAVKDYEPLRSLTQLNTLYLGSNGIVDLDMLEPLGELYTLGLNSNRIADLRSLRNLEKLRTLYLRDNAIEDLSPLLPLARKGIPLAWDYLERNSVHLSDNPLRTPPPAVVRQGNTAILHYFEELEKQGMDYLYEAKMLIIGSGGVGKTSLRTKLIDISAPLPREEATTRGIEIEQLTIHAAEDRELTVNIWDFGGQEIYHTTHQFFLTKRSLYILVDDTRSSDTSINDGDFRYWLQTIELLGGNSPLLIVQNKKGGRSKEIDLTGIQARFPFVKDKYATDLLTCSALDALEAGIAQYIQQLPHIGQALPTQWLKIREQLLLLAKERAYLSLEAYLELCRKAQIGDRDKALSLSSYLNDLGTFLHFRDDALLRKTVFLQNAWVTKAVYCILDDEVIRRRYGRFEKAEASRIWSDPSYLEMQEELLALMVKFELCYELDQKPGHYLIPQLLPGSRPADYHWETAQNLQLRYRYDFMPKGLLSRLMVRLHHYIVDEARAWKSGVNFEREGDTWAEVVETYAKNDIAIRVRGRRRKELMTIVSEEIDRINQSFEGIMVEQMIPCHCSECVDRQGPQFFTVEQLKKRQAKDIKYIRCERSLEEVLVVALVDDVLVAETAERALEESMEQLHHKLDVLQQDLSQTRDLLSFALTDSSKIKLPYLFTLRPPAYELAHNQSWWTTTYELQFYCMQPGAIHPHGAAEVLQVSKEWIAEMAPYSNAILTHLKGLSHLFLPGMYQALGLEKYKAIKPNLEAIRDTVRSTGAVATGTPLRQYGLQEASERSMALLEEVLAGRNWVCPLRKRVEGGRVIWVCEEHYAWGSGGESAPAPPDGPY